MFESKKILAFIGARAGSKGLKDKNIIDLAGKPLMAWTIEAALGSKYIDRTVVSTDGEQVAQIAKNYGADVPFLRPAELATDESLLDEAMQHAVQWLKETEGVSYDYLLLLQPTSPLRKSQHIDQAIGYYFGHQKDDQDVLMSVIIASKKVGWLMEEKRPGYVDFCFDHSRRGSRRQNLPTYYLPNGAIYFGPTGLMEYLSKQTARLLPFVMNAEASIDIDSQTDLTKAMDILKMQK